MLLERFEDRGLAHYSYAVACPAAGKMAVIDPRRDVDIYLEFARDRNLEIVYVLETHIHADYASGAWELAHRSGAELWLSAYDTGEIYEVTFPHHELGEGDELVIGSLRIQPLHTPGHTPEHLSFLLYDTTRSAEIPLLMFSGDFLFVGSLGRPDLLGEEAKHELAVQLYTSVREKLEGLPDGLEIYPAHGAGSMCGAGMSSRPTSTLGFERMTNPYLQKDLSCEAFVEKILSTVPPFPPYYRRMKELNAQGPALLNGLPGREALEVSRFRQLVEDGHTVIDLRDQLSFGAGHIPGALGIGAGTDLSTWAAWVVPYDTPLLLVSPDVTTVEAAVRALVRVGLDQIAGYLDGGIESWIRAGYSLQATPQISPPDLYRRLQQGEAICVLDVRSDAEWHSGHIPGALHIMGGELMHRLSEIPAGSTPLAVVCASGYRSTVAVSVLERAGVHPLLHVTGGMNAWRQAGLPLSYE
ncbi:MAG: MBL fold metallo-hydrolase [Nitrospinota bacterium]|nr:MAG: MBL fold metallo-hydrolase [Nitrospinota bacterium]